ncbi:MAG: ammonia-forming cytochrome c nitrite reductase subunit c552 [Deferribacteraceae bacterium]|nr:ammonia-forming cytochrome c nitrite reductase subunit c552 [Deferribacteraceae bacterium]
MRKIVTLFAVITLLPMLCFAKTPTKSSTAIAKAQKEVQVSGCYECHEPIQALHAQNMHKAVNCISCHTDLAKHSEDASIRPVTDLSWEACGTCHTDQMNTFMQTSYHRPARDEKSQPTNRIPVWWDKLMAPHGFTKEHALTRPHVMMLLDQYVVDRAFGGRFQPKNGWEYVLETGKVWDIIEDKYPNEKGQKAFLPQTATAANPICISCKTADHILDWAYMGDPGKGAKWDRTSNVVEFAKSTNYALNCYFCHDPHSAQPRIIRDALIDALSDPKGDSAWHKDPKRTKIKVITMGLRGYDRKIAILEKADSRLMCAQCHVEYNCNPGTDLATGQPVTFADRRTNVFPLQDSLHLYDYYFKKINFGDFKNLFDGATLWKAQHPEFETYYESTHSKLGIDCDECHMQPVMKGKNKLYTSHMAKSPRFIAKDTCLKSGCHDKWSEEQAIYTMDSIKAYTKGRMRKAEFWLSTLIDRIREAKNLGIDVKAAQTSHTQAHILWEYWTAENSDGFHNPSLARESLTRSITISSAAVAELEKAITEKVSAKK